jgi:sugar/nucleoside kinase (ribokinase family)
MTAPSWVVFAHLIIDNLHLPDGTVVEGRLGGAGTYAALGAALSSTAPVALVSGVGLDLGPEHRSWLDSYGIDTSALAVRGDHTPRSIVQYSEDGSRAETPVLGEQHFRTMDPTVADLPTDWTTAQGAYFFARHDAWQWPQVLDWTRQRHAALMWEISADACTADQFTVVAARLADVDMFSINLTEAQALCDATDPYECAATLRAAGAALLVLRMGADGALVADTDDLITTPAEGTHVIDPTGAGNCYSGAFLVSYRQTGNLHHAATTAATAAASVLGTYGVPPPRGLTPPAASAPPR